MARQLGGPLGVSATLRVLADQDRCGEFGTHTVHEAVLVDVPGMNIGTVEVEDGEPEQGPTLEAVEQVAAIFVGARHPEFETSQAAWSMIQQLEVPDIIDAIVGRPAI
jgi:hypothetical protein